LVALQYLKNCTGPSLTKLKMAPVYLFTVPINTTSSSPVYYRKLLQWHPQVVADIFKTNDFKGPSELRGIFVLSFERLIITLPKLFNS
jgi:hypothetical protein